MVNYKLEMVETSVPVKVSFENAVKLDAPVHALLVLEIPLATHIPLL